MKYGDILNRENLGYDAGHILDGEVVLDHARGEYVLRDDEGLAFSIQDLLKSLAGKKVRLTCVSFEAIQNLENMLEAVTMPMKHISGDVARKLAAVQFDVDEIERAAEQGRELRRAFEKQIEQMRAVTPDDLKSRSK